MAKNLKIPWLLAFAIGFLAARGIGKHTTTTKAAPLPSEDSSWWDRVAAWWDS